MASTKDTFEPRTFGLRTFACATFRGRAFIGFVCGELTVSRLLLGVFHVSSVLEGELQHDGYLDGVFTINSEC